MNVSIKLENVFLKGIAFDVEIEIFIIKVEVDDDFLLVDDKNVVVVEKNATHKIMEIDDMDD